MLTADSLRELLDYDQETGIFRYKNRKMPDVVAGSASSKGQWRITINSKRYYAQRLAWLYIYGVWPSENIKHKLNNAISNLKLVSEEKELTAERLREIINYNTRTGIFTWLKPPPSFNNKNGFVAGNKRGGKKNYWQIGVDNKRYYAHQLAWLYVYGIMPKQVDHVDGNGLNNAITNLRLATYSQNQGNRKVDIRNKLGIKGIRKHKGNTYSARIGHRYLGCFKTAEEAHQVYLRAAKQYFGEFARGG